MSNQNFSISQSHIAKLCPFYILINDKMEILSCGPALNKMLQNNIATIFNNQFSIVRPFTTITNFSNLIQICAQLVVMQIGDNRQTILRGQFEYIEDTKQLLFLGSPWFNSIEQIKASNLSFNDFAYHDPMIDLLHVLKAQEIANTDLKNLLTTINRQKKELKQASTQIQDFALLTTQSPSPMLRINIEGKVLMSNNAAKALDHFIYKGEAFCDSLFWQYISKQYSNKGPQWTVEAVTGNREFSFICIYIQELGYINIYGRDITESKAIEAELANRVKQFIALAENIPGVLYEYEFRADGTEGLRYISPAVERIFGIKPGEFFNYTQYISADDLQLITQKNERCKNTQEPFYVEAKLVVPGKDVKWHSVQSAFSYISANNAKVFTGVMIDITERKLAEEKLKANEEKYRNILANMKLGLLEVDTEDIITYANQSFCEMSGYDEHDLLGKVASSVFVGPGDFELMKAKNSKRKAGISDAYQVQVKNKQGEFKWWLISGAPRYNNVGAFVGSVGIHLDITEQKKLETELTQSKQNAERLAKSREVFLANMSHEIRTPMNAIMGMTALLAKTSMDEKQQFYVSTVQSALDSLLVILNDILDISKIEAGKLTLEKRPFDLRLLVEKTVMLMSQKATEKNINLKCAFFDPGIAPVLIGDQHRINQVLLNLLTNAIKFTHSGFVTINVKLLKNTGSIQQLLVEVEDSGIGMESQFVAKLFDTFTQENETIARQYGGTGLGLNICKQLVKLMEGNIFVKSQKGVGSIFSFDVHLQVGHLDIIEEHAKRKSYNKNYLNRVSILLVDDNRFNRIVASTMLKSYGATIFEAVNGKQAVQMATENKPDIILMDIQMPEMNGYEATAAIRHAKLSIPIIALTAEVSKTESDKCFASGMNSYLTKPFKELDLLDVIATHLNQNQAHIAASNQPA